MVTFVSMPMVVLYRPCEHGKIDPTETRSQFNVPTPEPVTSRVFYTMNSSPYGAILGYEMCSDILINVETVLVND